MAADSYRFRKTLLGNIVLQVMEGNNFIDATRNHYLHLLIRRNDWMAIVTGMVSNTDERATGKVALHYNRVTRKVYLMVEEYDSLLTQYPIEFVKAKVRHVVPKHLV